MSFKKITSMPGFWKTVAIFTVMFILLSNLFKALISYGFDFSKFVEKELSGDHWIMFLVSNILIGFIVGFALVYMNYKKTLKK